MSKRVGGPPNIDQYFTVRCIVISNLYILIQCKSRSMRDSDSKITLKDWRTYAPAQTGV